MPSLSVKKSITIEIDYRAIGQSMRYEITHSPRCSLFFLILFNLCALMAGCGPSEEQMKKLDPAISTNWKSRKVIETSGATSYIFEGDVMPPLKVNSDDYATLSSTEDVNAVLISLNLPTVSETRPDKGYLENKRVFRGEYHWPEYPLGPLIIMRTGARDNRTYEGYDAIWKVLIDKAE